MHDPAAPPSPRQQPPAITTTLLSLPSLPSDAQLVPTSTPSLPSVHAPLVVRSPALVQAEIDAAHYKGAASQGM